ncbi:hypothetical protein PsYK624_049440 [Phanerochaete sordida]|uniref:Uncharacterized protein n=1 Tax=Phanerochaete sordida TaxID=48140 RepID=A0A9P3LCG4_9APHY|nr:hypothetical protein PsYK624_049440 [Phanerochaete sordida]
MGRRCFALFSAHPSGKYAKADLYQIRAPPGCKRNVFGRARVVHDEAPKIHKFGSEVPQQVIAFVIWENATKRTIEPIFGLALLAWRSTQLECDMCDVA